jgi:cation diffusion facilitator family transporter
VREVQQDLERRATRGARASLAAAGISAALGAVKVVAGVVGNSYALIADGVESLLDIFASMVVLGGIRIGARPPDDNHPYGHGKAESMAAIVVALALLAGATGIAVQAVREIFTPHHTPAPFTLAVLVAVVVIKEILHARLKRVGRAVGSTALEADAWHHRSDALTSTAAFFGISIAVFGGPGFESADDWAALAACVIIAFNGLRILRVGLAEVMDEAAPPEMEARVREIAAAVDGVAGLDKCFARKSGQSWLVDLHVLVRGELSVVEGHAIGHDVKRALTSAGLGIRDVLVHIEPMEVTAKGTPRQV